MKFLAQSGVSHRWCCISNAGLDDKAAEWVVRNVRALFCFHVFNFKDGNEETDVAVSLQDRHVVRDETNWFWRSLSDSKVGFFEGALTTVNAEVFVS